MAKYVAFLRGVNLARRRRVTSAQLRSLFEALGFQDVDTFRASGNVVFEAGREPLPKMVHRIEEGLKASLGFEVVIFLRTASEIRAIAGKQPFARRVTDTTEGRLQVVMLASKPTTRTRNEVLAMATDDDHLALGDRELYWLPRAGTQNSALDFKSIDKLLGATTMRTKGTIEQLTAKHFSE